MAKQLPILILALCLASCLSSPEERAETLIKRFQYKTGQILLDSINDYPDCFELDLKAAAIRHDADSILHSRLQSLQELKELDEIDGMDALARQTREQVVKLIETARDYELDAISRRFKYDMSGRQNKQFLGYKYEYENDSVKVLFYFNTDITRIIGIQKTILE